MPNNIDCAQAFGIPSLEPEKSINFSAGFTARLLGHINVTADAYWIQIKDRIVLSGVFDRNNKYVRSVLLLYNLNIYQLQFFANAINTRTHGMDIVLKSNWKIKKQTCYFALQEKSCHHHLLWLVVQHVYNPADFVRWKGG